MTVTKIQAASTLMDLSGAFVMVDLQEIQLFAKVKKTSIIAPAVVQQGQFCCNVFRKFIATRTILFFLAKLNNLVLSDENNSPL
jgi:hypothetical protein